MNIFVKAHDFGFWTAQPITVYRTEKDSGLYRDITWCNHDGYSEEDLVQERIASDDTVHEFVIKAELCNKCLAWRERGENEWHEAPKQGVLESVVH